METIKNFITKLYTNENFPIYLGIAIAVLVVLFFLVLILGKKDQKKLEQTQKLEKIEDNLFKDVSIPVSVDANLPLQETSPSLIEEQNIVEQNQNETPIQMPQTDNLIQNQTIDNDNPILKFYEEKEPETKIMPPLEPVQETDTYEAVKLADDDNENSEIYEQNPIELNNEIENPIPVVEIPSPVVEPVDVTPVIEVPTQIEKPDTEYKSMVSTFEERLKSLEEEERKINENTNTTIEKIVENENKPKETKVLNVFSSVYTPPVNDDIEMLDLPKLKD